MKDSDHREKTVTSGTGRGSRKEAVSTMGWLQAGSPQLGPQWTNTMGTWNRCCRCLPLGWATLSSRQIYLWLSCFCSQSVSRAMLTDWLGLGRLVQNPSVLFAWEGLRIVTILWVCSLTVKKKLVLASGTFIFISMANVLYAVCTKPLTPIPGTEHGNNFHF